MIGPEPRAFHVKIVVISLSRTTQFVVEYHGWVQTESKIVVPDQDSSKKGNPSGDEQKKKARSRTRSKVLLGANGEAVNG